MTYANPYAPTLAKPASGTTQSSERIEMLVRGIRLEAEDIRSFELVAVDAASLPPWTPGAHVQVTIPGIDKPLTRAYSLCNHAGEVDCYRIAVKREAQSRGGSRAMHALQPGDRLHVSAPGNLFALDGSAQRHVLIAGGIGITPLYAMLNALHTASEAPCELHYFARSPGHLAFSQQLRSRARFHTGLDAAATQQVLSDIIGEHAHDPHTTFYTCGPTAFMSAVEGGLVQAGVVSERLRSERFAGDTVAGAAPTAGSFRIVFARNGIEADVSPSVSIIDVARAQGVDIPTSCEQGVCGACLSNVLEGQPQHHDAYLSRSEQAAGKLILPCVSRCAGQRLVIDR